MTVKSKGRKPPKKATAKAKPKPKSRPPVKPRALRHDTPVDVPAVEALAPLAFDPKAQAERALARVRKLETIEAAYEAWAELRAEHSGTVSKLSDERKQLDQQGEFLVGAVRAARDLGQTPTIDEALALARSGEGIESFVAETAGRLEAARTKLDEKTRAVESAFGDAFFQIREELRARIVRTLQHVKPRLKLMIRALGPEQRILHVARLDPDEAVLLAWVLLARLPSRYDFLFDDSTDDANLAPPTLYAEEGVPSGLNRPTVEQLQVLMQSDAQVLPIKGTIPFFLPRTGLAPQLTRLVERGPVMEVELGEPGGFRNVLTRDEAERVAGYFLTLKLEQRLEIELSGS